MKRIISGTGTIYQHIRTGREPAGQKFVDLGLLSLNGYKQHVEVGTHLPRHLSDIRFSRLFRCFRSDGNDRARTLLHSRRHLPYIRCPCLHGGKCRALALE